MNIVTCSDKPFNKNLIFQTTVFLFLSNSFYFLPVYAATSADIKLINSSANSVTLEFNAADIETYGKAVGGKEYQDIRMPGTGLIHEPGKPRVPSRGTLIAVPSDGDIQVDVLSHEIDTRNGYVISPAPLIKVKENGEDVNGRQEPETEEVLSPDDKVYKANRFWPDSPVKVGIEGFIRDQRVAQIQFYPVMNNPVQKKIRIYKRLVVRVTFKGNPRKAKEDSPGHEKMLKGVLANDAGSGRVFHPPLSQPSGLKTADFSGACVPEQTFSIKISVENTGMYSLTYTDFLTYGINMSGTDPRLLEMRNQGVVVPILVTGENDGVFNQGDEIIFYGEAMTGDFTATNVYWLSINPAGGSRMGLIDGTPFGSAPVLNSYRTTAHVEQNYIYWSYMPNGEGKEHWFWDDLYAGQTLDMTVSLNNLASTSETATVRVMLYGKTDDPRNPDHHTKVLLNGVEIHDAYWNGQGTFLHEASVPQSSLLEGANIITLRSAGGTGAVVDIVYVNYAEIDYRDSYTVEADKLRFDGEGSGQYNMEPQGFTQGNIFLYDITDPYNVASVVNADIQPDGMGGYKLRFGDVINGENNYTALTSSQFLKPSKIEPDSPSNLKDVCNQADYIIIHHDSFDVTGLMNVLSGRGYQLTAVRISDVYDEFNYGIFDPQAIKDFLTYAYENYTPPRPAYVLLVGDANQDYFNRLGYGINYVPTHIMQTNSLGEMATDNWFVTLSGNDPFPEMFLGRISVRTQADLDGVVSKISGYRLNVPQDGWNQNVLLVADNEARFENLNNNLIQNYLSGFNARKVYLTQYPIVDNATQAIVNYINSGALVTNYAGHGSISTWAGEKMFEIPDIASLNNPDRFTFVMALDCINGWFSYYSSDYVMAEEFLRANAKGAVGVWAPTGLGYTPEHEILASELFNDLFNNEQTELGPLTTGAKISAVANYGIATNNLEMYTLFGDPTTRLHLPTTNISPVANAGSHYSGIEGQAIILDGSASTDADGSIVLYEWDIDNDGIYEYSSSLPTRNYTYTQHGTYTIKLRVTDDLGAKDVALATAGIADTTPTADFTGAPTSGNAPFTVNFTNSSTGYDQPLSYEWDFDNNGVTDSTMSNPANVYASPGTYTVKLKVTDSDGSQDTFIRTDYITAASSSTYNLTVTVNGNGRVISSPLGIDCGTDCAEDFGSGAVVTLTASPSDSGSIFTGWSGGACSGTGNCVVTMNADTTVSATFELCSNRLVRIAGANPVYFPSLQSAYDTATDGDVIQSQAVTFIEDLNINRNIIVTHEGGYDCGYATAAGKTTLNGAMSVSDGSNTVENFVLE